MANTYTQLYVHIVFAVKGRQSLIPKRHKSELHKYITGIITNKKQNRAKEVASNRLCDEAVPKTLHTALYV